MMTVARALAERATCIKRRVGCVLTDANGRILSTGYNGVPHHHPHCIEHPCPGATNKVGSDTCQAVHAEINALLQCRDVQMIHTCYATVLPCNSCMKTLLNTSCHRIVYHHMHEHYEFVTEQWAKAGRMLIQACIY